MTWLKMPCYMRHFPRGCLELIPEKRDLQSERDHMLHDGRPDSHQHSNTL